MQNDQIKLSGGHVVGGSNSSSFVFSRAHAQAQEIFAKYKFASATSREEFMKSMDGAIEDLAQ